MRSPKPSPISDLDLGEEGHTIAALTTTNQIRTDP
jgi:hypothetical protein